MLKRFLAFWAGLKLIGRSPHKTKARVTARVIRKNGTTEEILLK